MLPIHPDLPYLGHPLLDMDSFVTALESHLGELNALGQVIWLCEDNPELFEEYKTNPYVLDDWQSRSMRLTEIEQALGEGTNWVRQGMYNSNKGPCVLYINIRRD